MSGLERLPSNRMRQYVRAWINEWDLRRLDPSYEPVIEAATLEVDLSEDARLEGGESDVEGDLVGDGDSGRGQKIPVSPAGGRHCDGISARSTIDQAGSAAR